jgi:transcription factor STE12
MNQEPTTRANAEPALSFYYDSSMTLFDQLTKAVQQSNSSANSLGMNRARTQSIGDPYRPSHSRQHSRQQSEMMPPPLPQMSMQSTPQEEYASYLMHDSQLQDLEPSASIVQRQMESTPFMPMPYGQQQYRNAAMSCPPFAGGLEYSPAPSFTGQLSSDDYAQGRAMTYAPETPPQSQASVYGLSGQVHPYALLPTPEASISGDIFTPHRIVLRSSS